MKLIRTSFTFFLSRLLPHLSGRVVNHLAPDRKAGRKAAPSLATFFTGLSLLMLAPCEQAAANVINIGDAELLYSNAQLPFTMDASFATLKRDSGSMDLFQTDRGTSVYPLRYHGSLAYPLQIHDPNAGWDFSGLYTDGVSGPWLGNIYDDGSGTLIGLIHTEDFSANTADFTIGLAKSTDGGANWKYLGDVLQPYANNASMDLAYCSNIGGLPYLIIGDYMYVYFNEHTAIDLSGEKRLAVARALVSDIMTAAASDTVPVFYKYAGGVWTQDGLTGLADNIIPNGVSSHGNQYISPDFHSDAAYCAPLGKYLITVQTHAQGKLLLFTSTDGLNWGDETLVDSVSGYSQPYSTFVSLNSDASNDCHVVGNEFYLIYPHKSVSDYGDDTLYRRRFTIEPVQDTHLVWDPNGNGTDGAGTWNASDLVWTNQASGGADIAWSNSTNDTAVFGVGNGTAGVVSVSGNLTLGDITFNAPGSGNYTLSGGTLTLAGNPSVILANADATVDSVLAGEGFIKNGRGTLTLSGENTYTGDTTINAGTLSITGGSLSNSSAIEVSSGATLTTSVNNTFGSTPTAPWTIAGTISGTATAQSMPPNVTLNNGTMSGNTFASYGTFLVPGTPTTITANGSNNVISAGNIGLTALLTVNTPNATDALAISSVLGASSANTGGLSKTGAGTLTLSGENISTGLTTVGNGELMISTAFAGNGDFSVTDGATLAVSNLSNGSAQISNLTVSDGATLEFHNVTNQAAPLVTASDLIVSGSCTVTITGVNGLEVDANYPLIDYTGTFSGQFADLHLQMPDGYEGTLLISNNQLSLWVSSISVPNGLTVTPGDNQVTLNWTAPAGATSYNVMRATTSDGPYTLIANPSTNSYTDTTATNGTAYYYTVSALSGSGESPDSIEVSAVPQIQFQAYLKFDETSGATAADASGHGWDGTLVNGPTWGAGYSNNAVNLSGSDQYVTLPSGVVDSLTDFTISMWVKQTSISTWSRIFDFGTGQSVYMFLTPRGGDNVVRFSITTSGGAGEQKIDGTTELPTGVWTHVAVTHSGNTGILYVDGVPVGTNNTMTLTPADLGSTGNNYIGKSQYDDPYFNGQVDDFRIYPTALTASQVNDVITATSPSAPIINIADAPAPLFDDPVFHGATDPFVIWNPKQNLWFMYYTQRRSSMPNPTGVEWVYGTAIGIATSPDGINWTYAGICQGDHDLSDPLASTVGVGPEPGVTFWAPCYFYEGTTLHMFVTYINGVYTDWGGTRTIIHFTSTDGVNFTYAGVCDLGNSQVIDPSVYKVGSTYYMVYKNESDGQSTWVAESTDLTTWTNPRRTSPDTFQEAPFVFQWNGSWWLIVDSLGDGGLRIYQSANGIDGWTENNVVLTHATHGVRPGDDNVAHHPGIVVQTLDDGTEQCLLYYFTHQANLSVMQVAELELGADGKVTCDRNKYAAPGDVLLDLKLNETSGTTASDSSGNGWPGTLVNSPTWTTGKIGNALDLASASSQYVTLPTSVTRALGDYTISTWVYLNSISNFQRIFDFGTGTDNYMFLTPQSDSGKVRFAIRTPSVSEQIIDGSAALPTGAWTHVAVTLSGTTGKLYVNGALVGTNTDMTLSPTSLGITTLNYLGKSQGDDPYLNGKIDEFRIYNRALDTSELAPLVAGQLLPPSQGAAVVSPSKITLSWAAPYGATGFNVKRSLTSGGPYITVSANQTATSYVDTSVSDYTSYYYVISALGTAGESANSAEVKASDLRAHLKFDETSGATAADASGNGLNATLVNGATWTTGQSGNAGSFASTSSQYATLPTGAVSSIGDFTISTWVYLNSVSNFQRIFDFGTGTDNYMFLSPQSETGKMRFAIRTPSVSEQIINGTAALPTGEWTHVAVTCTGLIGKLYVNGVLVGINTGMTLRPSLLGTTTLNYFGKSQFDDPYLNGKIDEFRIYNRAMSVAEIEVLASPFDAPQNIVATPGNSQISLSWDAVDGADGYTIRRAVANVGPYSELATGISSTTHIDTGLADGETWYYTIAAYGWQGEGVISDPVSATTYTAIENWRFTNFGTIDNTGKTADDADPDGDNWTNGEEFASGTDPNNSQSLLKVSQMQVSGSDRIVSFDTVLGKTYRVERSNTLAVDSWTTVEDNIAGTDGTLQITDVGGAAQPKRFYRIVLIQ